MPAEYQDAELQSSAGGGSITIRRNAYFGRPLATCVREYLEMRNDRMPVKEATTDEIIAALKEGGFDLDRISTDADDARRGVAITLAKNPQFHRLPNDDWGLLVWYPNVKRGKEKTNGGKADEKAEDKGEDKADAFEEIPPLPPKAPAKPPGTVTAPGASKQDESSD